MDEKVKRLLKVYSELAPSERKEVRDFIDDFERKSFLEKRSANESLNKSLGPLLTNSCVCCGK
ncbi:hypothetical protein MG290_14780 (plasmid) [Flavobacterium sp. CBA20B-1]|uniref:hypothetical protein n=1 Tax=unclassified Flavobacterium TaxID=196869 RepID=UPI0022254EC8|nr:MULTISPECIES: hypothetical protein [unclassified Flavobacterium]WCM43608.1 hypothetical protein MG290_14780 [Flavobacterium sp. CBA20B-1]